jgi:hypothetical protein
VTTTRDAVLPPLTAPESEMHNRQLAIYDFGTQPISFGDFYVFLQASLTWSAHHGVADVDLCVVCDPSSIRTPEFAGLKCTEGALRSRIFELLPVAQMHPGVRSIHIVDHVERAYEMLLRPGAAYHSSWPPIDLLRSGEYLWYVTIKFFDQVYHLRPIKPRLRARAPIAQWAREFLVAHAQCRTSVTVNLRMNPAHSAKRNMNADVWRAFFDHASRDGAVSFFLLGSATENFDCFRSCSNVVVTKDWLTDVERDLALIEYASIHMGSSSGPAMFPAFLEDKPTTIVNSDALPQLVHYRDALRWDGQFLRFNFGNPNYRLTAVAETVDFLNQALASMLQLVGRHREGSAAGVVLGDG